MITPVGGRVRRAGALVSLLVLALLASCGGSESVAVSDGPLVDDAKSPALDDRRRPFPLTFSTHLPPALSISLAGDPSTAVVRIDFADGSAANVERGGATVERGADRAGPDVFEVGGGAVTVERSSAAAARDFSSARYVAYLLPDQIAQLAAAGKDAPVELEAHRFRIIGRDARLFLSGSLSEGFAARLSILDANGVHVAGLGATACHDCGLDRSPPHIRVRRADGTVTVLALVDVLPTAAAMSDKFCEGGDKVPFRVGPELDALGVRIVEADLPEKSAGASVQFSGEGGTAACIASSDPTGNDVATL